MAFKGDIISASVGEVLQMLYHNEKQGILRIMGPDMVKSINCSREGVSLLNPAILDQRYFIDVIVTAGLAEEEAVEKAAKKAGKNKSLRKALVKAGVIEEFTANRIFNLHLEEEIYSLLKLTSGEFEFIENAAEDSTLGEQELPVFPIAEVLLEYAKRTDEWNYINQYVDDLDAVFAVDPDVDVEEEKTTYPVLDLVNGQRTVRQIADCLLCLPVMVAKDMADLVKRGMLRPVDRHEFLAIAKDLLNNQEIESVSMILRQLKPKLKKIIGEDVDVSALADLYSKEGDQKTAINLLLEKASLNQGDDQSDESNPVLEQAHKMDPEDTRVLKELADNCAREGDTGGKIQHLISLTHHYLLAEQYERALNMFAEILSDSSGDASDGKKKNQDKNDGPEQQEALEDLEKFISELMPDFLVQAKNREGAVSFLERVINDLGRKWDPEEVARIYHCVIEADSSQKAAT